MGWLCLTNEIVIPLGHRLISRFLVQHLHHQDNNFGEVFCLTFVLVAVCFQASLDVDQAALLEIFLADLAQASPGFQVDPFGVFFRSP